ncbi:MAG TPA: hypothetical protein PLQ52_08220 [Lacunisphaera sp.]|jgi:hypothetical protein|nr:hypothetical protein [Lacunisphaera sp.]HQY06036.1 hypothetical protein [Lacunisphaera sp.]
MSHPNLETIRRVLALGLLLAGMLLAGCANMDWDSLKAGARRMHEQNQDRYGDDYPQRAAKTSR